MQQASADKKTEKTQTNSPKLSILVDHTGFLSIKNGLHIRNFSDAFSDRTLIHLLGAPVLIRVLYSLDCSFVDEILFSLPHSNNNDDKFFISHLINQPVTSLPKFDLITIFHPAKSS